MPIQDSREQNSNITITQRYIMEISRRQKRN
uniref:Uncharacterized protein n=1 Tax=Rhizophora mucronata TaxID=61149 RepID=A0A2P2PRH2_RHIMU